MAYEQNLVLFEALKYDRPWTLEGYRQFGGYEWPRPVDEQRSLVLHPDVALFSIAPANSHDHPSRVALALASVGFRHYFIGVGSRARWEGRPKSRISGR